MRAAFLVLLSLSVALVGAETMLRNIAPIYTAGIRSSYEYDSILGVRLKKNFSGSRITDHLEEVRTNRYGIVDHRENYSAYAREAFALGDSYTQGTGLPLDAAYPAQLDIMLNQDSSGRYAPRTAVLNLGLGSYGGEQSLLTLQRFAKELGAPAWCLYVGADNDRDDDLMFRNGIRHRHLVDGTPRWRGMAGFLGAVSDLQIVIRFRTALAERRLRQLRSATEPGDQQATDTTSRAGVVTGAGPSSTAEAQWPVIGRIISTCRGLGANVIITWADTQPMESYEWLRAKAASEGVLFNDWYPRVQSVREAIPSLPLENSHSARHYRGWVMHEMAAGFAALMQ